MSVNGKTKGSGTVGSFNFIRRIGFPSTVQLFSILSTLILFSFLAILPQLGVGLSEALFSGLILTLVPVIIGEALNGYLVLRDRVLTFRRLLGLELLSWILLPILLCVFGGLEIAFHIFRWQDAIIFLVAFSLPIRILTLCSLTSGSLPRKIAGGLLPPILVLTIVSLSYPGEIVRAALTLAAVSTLSVTGVARLIGRVDENGFVEIGASPMGMFRAFLAHWLDRDPGPLEASLSALGVDETISTTILGFYDRHGVKGGVVVSGFHPGPYRDLGSGGLPSLTKQHLQTRIGGIFHVPHGISGHQTNIITRKDVNRLLQGVADSCLTRPDASVASPMTRRNHGAAKASGQAFGPTVLVTFTMSPEDMEDLPLELAARVQTVFSKNGFNPVLVDAHNSMRDETVVTPAQANQLGTAAEELLDLLKGVKESGFKAGFSEDPLFDFTREDGIGPGGVSVLVVESQGQRVAYLTIDGNNMEAGFREAILSSLTDLNVVDGEVMTTDTHLVTGLVRSPLGYYPVGSHLDKALLLRRIHEAVSRAINELEDSVVGVSQSSLTVRVLGKETFLKVTRYIGKVGREVRKLLYILEIGSMLIAAIILAILAK